MALDRSLRPQSPGLSVLDQAGLADVEAIRLLLGGGSVIDWHQLAFCDYEEVDRFLRVNEFDPEEDDDLNRLEELRDDAVEYLARNLNFRVAAEVGAGVPVRELFLMASDRKGRHRIHACVVLKVMHVIHHLAGRELTSKLPISDAEMFGYVERKVMRVVEELRAAGYAITEFAWSRKEHDSLVTKLLAKKTTLAANIYDKLRFRLVVRAKEDLPAILLELMHRLIPFNYLLPGEAVNTLLPFNRLVAETASFRRYLDQIQEEMEPDAGPASNEFSGPAYRVVNFVADLPIRMDSYLERMNDVDHIDPEFGNIVFVLTEFQVIDAETARHNEMGENSHEAYKARQHDRVKARLAAGARAFRSRDEGDDGDDESGAGSAD